MNLFIDTHSKFLNIGLLKEGNLIDSIEMESSNDHSTNTIYNIDLLFKRHKIDKTDIKSIFVINGPGSFTGVRIGVSIAKVLAWTLNIPIITLSSLELIALSVKDIDFIAPVIDARRGYVYGAIYDDSKNIIMEEQYIKLDVLKKRLESLDGTKRMVSIEDNNYSDKIKINIEEIVKKHINDEGLNPHKVCPNYLKKTEAEENLS